MATYDKPTTSFYVNYGDLDPLAAQSSLAPVLIAPRYTVYRSDDYDNTYFGKYSEIHGEGYTSIPLTGATINFSALENGKYANVLIKNADIDFLNGSTISGCTCTPGEESTSITAPTAVVLGDVGYGDTIIVGGTTAKVLSATKTGTGYTFLVNAVLPSTSTGVVSQVVGVDRVAEATLTLSTNSATDSGVTIENGESVEFSGGTYKVVDGDVYVEYRQIRTEDDGSDFSDLRTNLTSDAREWAGKADPWNPMGLMYQAATLAAEDGAFFYMVSVGAASSGADTDAVYIAALNYVAQFEAVYALVPYKNSAAVQAEVMAVINKYAVPTSAQYKHGWLAAQGTTTEAIANEARAINNYHVNLVAAGRVDFLGFEDVNKAYLCAALASLRGSIPPHAPMNAMVIPGFVVKNQLGIAKWTDVDFTTMNNAGAFIVYRDVDENTVVYHQITTRTDGTMAEDDSVVSNGEAIIRQLRIAVKKLCGGQGNATEALLNSIRAKIITVLTSIQGEYYPDLYGPRILNWDIVRLYIPEGNRRSVRCQLDIDLPEPTQNVRFDFNLF